MKSVWRLRAVVNPKYHYLTSVKYFKNQLQENGALIYGGPFSSLILRQYSSSPPVHIHAPRQLEGATCMITGGSSGIGLGIAQRFLLEGAEKIILVGRNKQRLYNALSQLDTIIPIPSHTDLCLKPEEGAHSEIIHQGRFCLVVGDVGNPSFWGEDVKKLMDPVDILVNAAGVSHSSLLSTAKDEHISQMLNTNLQGTILASRTMARRAFRLQRRGARKQSPSPTEGSDPSSHYSGTKCIINVSSLHASKGGVVGVATYASTKAGVIALTRALVAETSLSAPPNTFSNLRVNVIVPGYVETDILDELSEQFRENAKQSIPVRRFGTVEEVADATMFLATNQYANNCVLNLDGGLSAM
ncbi:hypothetical protein FQN57_002540 [Myotisia sp. PD_48]|nr:hypothetical protein FQN57_002540 [Myotisia sp. PD_48]